MLNSMYVASIIAAALALPLNGNFTVSKAEFGKTDPAHLNLYGLSHCVRAYHANQPSHTASPR